MAAKKERAPDRVAALRTADRQAERETNDGHQKRDHGRAEGQATSALEDGGIEGRPRRHGVGPRMPSTVDAVRAAAGASKKGMAATPAIPAMIGPGKIWMALFS